VQGICFELLFEVLLKLHQVNTICVDGVYRTALLVAQVCCKCCAHIECKNFDVNIDKSITASKFLKKTFDKSNHEPKLKKHKRSGFVN